MLFLKFTERWEKQYATTEEREKRFNIFKQNLLIIGQMNVAEGHRVFGLTKFTDLTQDEFTTLYLGYKPRNLTNPVSVKEPQISSSSTIPKKFDWRTKGAITPVKNQGWCGSCWAFSATEQIESMWFLATNTLPILSPQQLVDCDDNDDGCFGGNTITAYEYIMSQGGLDTAASYPYVGLTDESCKFKNSDVGAQISGFYQITTDKNELLMQSYIAQSGPISVCLDALAWQFYIGDGGIIRSWCGQSLNHCVQITGYSIREKDNVPYWIIRNCWGHDWGNGGYVYVEMFKNLCAVADEPTTVIIN